MVDTYGIEIYSPRKYTNNNSIRMELRIISSWIFNHSIFRSLVLLPILFHVEHKLPTLYL